MNKQLLSILFLTAFLAPGKKTAAQSTPLSGTVTYEEIMKMGIEKNEENAQFFDMLPKEQKSSKILYFTPAESIYMNGKTESKPDMEHSEGGARMVIHMDVPDEKYYQDITAGTMLIQRDFMGRKFLVQEDARAAKWKLTGNQQTILGYPCQEATKQEGDVSMTAWFTPALAVSTGPSNAGGLPGLILKLDVNNGLHTMVATSVNLGPVADGVIKKPKDGKKMTKEQFRAMMDEKAKEMDGDGSNVIIKVRH